MFLVSGLFNSVAGVLHSIVQGVDDAVSAFSSTPALNTLRTIKIKKISSPIKLERREIVDQVFDNLRQTYVTRPSIGNSVCIICVFKAASWLKLEEVIKVIDQSIIETCRELAKFGTNDCNRDISLLTAIQQSFGVIVPKLSRLLELGTTLAQRIEQENLNDEDARETEEFVTLAGIRDSYGVHKGGLIDQVTCYITQWLKDHGRKSYVQSHFQPLFDFWDENEINLCRFKSWPTISLVDPDPKPLVIKHLRKWLSPEELISADEIYSIVADQAGSDLIEKLHFYSVFIIGPKNGALELIDTVFPIQYRGFLENLFSSAPVDSSSSSGESAISSHSESSGTPAFVRGNRIDTGNQQKMADLVQSAVWRFREQIPGLPLQLSMPRSTRLTTSPRHPTPTSAAGSSLTPSPGPLDQPQAPPSVQRLSTSSTTPDRPSTSEISASS